MPEVMQGSLIFAASSVLDVPCLEFHRVPLKRGGGDVVGLLIQVAGRLYLSGHAATSTLSLAIA